MTIKTTTSGLKLYEVSDNSDESDDWSDTEVIREYIEVLNNPLDLKMATKILWEMIQERELDIKYPEYFV